MFRVISLLLAGLCAGLQSSSTFSPARPPAIPLAVRNPYLNLYLFAGSDGGNGGYLAGQNASFWTGSQISWTGLIRVDEVDYIWMGAPGLSAPLVRQSAFSYTSTRSTFTMHVNNAVEMQIEFLSPVFPKGLKRQSFPVSYMDVKVSSLDGKSHFVQLYTDTTAQWVSGDRASTAQWEYSTIKPSSRLKRHQEEYAAHEKRQSSSITTYGTETAYTGWTAAVTQPLPTQNNEITLNYPSVAATPAQTSVKALPTNKSPGGLAYHKFYRQQQIQFGGFDDQTQFGNWYYATDNVVQLTHQSGSAMTVRNQFHKNGYLLDTADTDYRPIENNLPTFAFSKNLGMVEPGKPSTTLFTINLAQTNVVQFEGASGIKSLPALWTSYYPNDLSAVNFFYNDYAVASERSTILDRQIEQDSTAAAGQNYLTATSLAVRQSFGATQLAGEADNPLLFVKEISSDGNVNTADVLFPYHPIALYLNPNLLKMALDPLFINQEAGNWPFAFAIHDIGSLYPNATGHNDGMAEQQPLEECGNMIIMTLAYAQRANDNAYLAAHYDILRQWNEFLVQEALIPEDQISTDDFAGSLANQTNLALKGIIGIRAMAEIAERTGHKGDAQNFTNIAENYIKKWYNYGIAMKASPPHTTLAYGMNDTHGLLYNLYADRELGLGLVNQNVYDMQSAFYPTVNMEYGVPLDTRHLYTKDDWSMFCAAIASTSTRKMFVDDIAKFIAQTPTQYPFTDIYMADTAQNPSTFAFKARPVIGGMFALLALNSAPKTSS